MAARCRPAFLLLPAVAFLLAPSGVHATGRGGVAARYAEVPPAARPAADGAGTEASVQIVGLRMFPGRLEIATGTTVTWVNSEPVDYPVVGGSHELLADDGSWKSPRIAPGTRWSRRFNQPGTVAYRSAGHATATGELVISGPPIVDAPSEVEVAIAEADPDDPTTWGFEPADVIVETGTTVIWRNNGKNVHTVTADGNSVDSGDLQPGTTWRHTFEQPGTFAYHCTPHPWMQASVRVVIPGGEVPPPPPPAGNEPSAAAPAPSSPAPPAVRAAQGPVRHSIRIVEPSPVRPSEWAYDPGVLDVKVGDTVVWRNAGTVDHSVMGEAFDSGLLKPGVTWERTFDGPGVWSYRCRPHPWMTGVVRVTEFDAQSLPTVRAPLSPLATTARPRPDPPVSVARPGNGPVRHHADVVEEDLQKATEWRSTPGWGTRWCGATPEAFSTP